ncbi:MAG: hypothetical protein R3D27_12495 [Hyphomicrobiaceae bacterium]
MTRRHINPQQWQNNVGIARTACARIFRDGGRPADALAAFGLEPAEGLDWSRAVDQIAAALSAQPFARAA